MLQKGCTDKRVNVKEWSDYSRMCYHKFCAGANEQKAWSVGKKNKTKNLEWAAQTAKSPFANFAGLRATMCMKRSNVYDIVIH